MAHVLKIVQNGVTLVDLLDTTKYKLMHWSRTPYSDARKVSDALTLHALGSTADALNTNLNAIGQTLLSIKQNAAWAEQSKYRVPIWLQVQANGASNLVQAELMGGDEDAFQDVLGPAINSKYLLNLPFKFERRPYFEETSQQSLYSGSAISNNGSSVSLSGARGNLLMPLYIKNRTSLANQTRMIVGLKTIGGTLSNFVCKYEGDSADAYGSNMGAASSAGSFSGSAGKRWTPGGAASDQRLCLWYITSNVQDQQGVYRVMARVRDNATTPKVAIRARGGNYDGSNVDWGTYPNDGVSKYCVTGNGTIELVDCGIINLPAVDTAGVTPYGFAIELRGLADSGVSTFDVDCIYLVPCEGFGKKPGMGILTMRSAAGTGALPDFVLDANDRKPRGYLETTGGAVLATPQDLRGGGIFMKPGTSGLLFVLTQNDNTGAHDISGTNTLTVTGTARYSMFR